MGASFEETLAEMEELENEDSEVDSNSNTDSKCSSRNLEVDESDAVTSEYAALYKVTKVPESQEKRRKKLLEKLKERRNQDVNKKRGLVELLSNDNSDLEDTEIERNESQEEPMDVAVKPKRRRRKRRNCHKTRLMLSEWFTEIPADLESEWLVKLCPVGVRNLIVADFGVTKAYNKYGVLFSTFQSALPGGNQYHSHNYTYTVLDCIYSTKLNCYFVLDVIVWNGRALELSDAELRFFWIKSKMEELPEAKEVNSFNKYPFYEIDYFPAELPSIEYKLSQPYQINDQLVALDGILFYHRLTHYISAQTPLVGWLKPFMILEMLNVPVDESFMSKMPSNYKSMQEYIENGLKNKQKQRRRKRHNNEVQMET